MVQRLGYQEWHRQFVNKCLWSDRVSNIEQWQRSAQPSVDKATQKQKWKWFVAPYRSLLVPSLGKL